MRSQAGPPKTDSQSVGGSSPSVAQAVAEDVALAGGRARAATASASWNHSCRFEEWLGTMSTMSWMPAACSAADISSKSARVPSFGVDVAVVVDVVAAVGERRRVERARARRRRSPSSSRYGTFGGDALEVAEAVTVGVGEAARVDLVDRRLAPPVGVGGEVGTGQGCQRGGVGQRRFLRVWEGFW